MTLALRPFLSEHLGLVKAWFDHPEVQERLGGPEWPARSLELQARDAVGEEFRGAIVLRQHTWLAWLDDVPVAYLGGEVYDRLTTWDGSTDPGRILAEEPGPAMSAAYVVDPDRWRRGLGAATLRAWQTARETADVRVLSLGIDHDNLASSACARAAGFSALDPTPDWEGIVHHVWRR